MTTVINQIVVGDNLDVMTRMPDGLVNRSESVV